MKRYFSSLKQYSWILLASIIVATAVGFLIARTQLSIYQVSSVLLVNSAAPGASYNGGPTPGTSTDDLGQALNYSAEIMTTGFMSYVINNCTYDSQHLKHLGFTPEDLIVDVVPTTSTTAATVTLLASARSSADALALANDVANCYVAYKTAALQTQLTGMRTSLQTQITAQQGVVANWSKQLGSLSSTTDPRYNLYLSNLNSANTYLNTLQGQLQVLPTTVKADVFMIQQATPADVTASLKGYIILGATAGVGLLVGFLIMLLVIFTDSRLRSDEQVKEKLGLAYLGGLSNDHQLRGAPTHIKGETLHTISNIAASLRLTGVLPGTWRTRPGAVLLVTSPREAEGKSTVAAALSVAMAKGGNSVLVMDGNLQQPSTHLAFRMSNSGRGLSALLNGSGRENVSDSVQRTDVPGVWLLPAGPAVDSAALLMEQKLPGILAQLRREADVVIIDGPALLSSADASLLATMSDGIALVIDVRHEKLPLLLRAKDILNSLTHTPVGLIMNRLAQNQRTPYYASPYLGNTVAEQQQPIQVQMSNSNEVGGRLGVSFIGMSQDATALPTRFNAPSLMPPSGPTVPPTPPGVVVQHRLAPPVSSGLAPQPANGSMPQDRPGPSPRPAPSPRPQNNGLTPLIPRSGTGE